MTLPPLPDPDVSWVDGTDEWGYDDYSHAYSDDAMRAYGEACAAAERGLVAEPQGEHQQHWCTYCRGVNAHNCQFNPNVPRMQTYATTSTAPLYAHSPQQRKPLTDRQAIALWADRSDGPANHEIISFARAIERAYGINGT